MRKERVAGAMSRWQEWRWVLADVVAQQDGWGSVPRRLDGDEDGERWLHPGFEVDLYAGDAEGYYLNATTEAPCWFVKWRLDEVPDAAGHTLARPEAVSLSYHDAGRWLDAQEMVEQVPAQGDIVKWMRDFVDAHYVPEPKRRQRPESFKSLQDRFGNPAVVTTEKKKFKGGGDE